MFRSTTWIAVMLMLGSSLLLGAGDSRAEQDERVKRQQEREQRREQLREKMREKWQRGDQDGSGSINRQEAERLPRLNPRVDAIDRNRDGSLTPQELRSFREERQAEQRERMERADRDGSGNISRAEAQHRMPRLYEHFDEVDADRDGTVSQEEIRAFWRRRAQERRIERGAPDPRF